MGTDVGRRESTENGGRAAWTVADEITVEQTRRKDGRLHGQLSLKFSQLGFLFVLFDSLRWGLGCEADGGAKE